MSDQQSLADQLRERRKGKPGELTLATGVALMLISPFVLAIVETEGKHYSILKSQGVVSQAEVTAHKQKVETHTSRKGRERSYTLDYLVIRLDANSSTSYSQWKKGGKIAASQYPVVTTAEVAVPEDYVVSHPVGASRPVVLLRGDTGSIELVEQLERETSASYFLKYYLAMAALFAVGVAMTVMGWRKRFPRG